MKRGVPSSRKGKRVHAASRRARLNWRARPEADAARIIVDDPRADEMWALSRLNKLALYARRHSVKCTALILLVLLGGILRSPGSASHHGTTLAQHPPPCCCFGPC